MSFLHLTATGIYITLASREADPTHDMLAVLAILNACLIVYSATYPQSRIMPNLCDRLEANLRERHSESDASTVHSFDTIQLSLDDASRSHPTPE